MHDSTCATRQNPLEPNIELRLIVLLELSSGFIFIEEEPFLSTSCLVHVMKGGLSKIVAFATFHSTAAKGLRRCFCIILQEGRPKIIDQQQTSHHGLRIDSLCW